MKSDKELIKFSITGTNEEAWYRMHETFLKIIEKIAKKVEDQSNDDHEATQGKGVEMLKDLASIATQWAKGHIEKPSLENEKLKAQIAESFANTKRIIVETEKIEEETQSLRLESRHKSIKYYVEELEMLFKMMQTIH